MTGFLIGAAIAVVLVLGLLLRPFFRKSSGGQLSQRQFNAAILRDQLAKLDQDVAEGTLSEADHAQARAELQRRALEDTREQDAANTLRAPKKTMAAVSVLLPLAAVALYLLLGNPAGLSENGTNPHQQMANQQDLEKMVMALAEKLEKEPNNLKGWAMLARSYSVLGRHPEALKAYEKAVALRKDDANLLADYADSLAMQNNRVLAGEPLKLVERALKIDPRNPKALSMAGSEAFDRQDYAKAIQYWQQLVDQGPADGPMVRQILPGLEQARQLVGQTSKSVKLSKP